MNSLALHALGTFSAAFLFVLIWCSANQTIKRLLLGGRPDWVEGVGFLLLLVHIALMLAALAGFVFIPIDYAFERGWFS